MKTFSKEQLEEIFEQSSSVNIPECIEHRYELRRKLLNSRYFDAHRNNTRHRALIFVPVVASGFVAVILFVVIQTSSPINIPTTLEEKTEIVGNFDSDFLTDGLTATFMDDRPMVPITLTTNTVPFSTASARMTVQ